MTTRTPPRSWTRALTVSPRPGAAASAADGVGLTLVPITGAGSDVQRVADAVVDGFIVWTTSEDDPVLGAVAARGLSAVVHAGPRRPGLPLVGIDDRAAAAAIGALVFAGARRPAVLSFPHDRGRARQLVTGPPAQAVTFPLTRLRWQGFHDAWRRAGGASAELRVAVCPVNSAAGLTTLAQSLRDQGSRCARLVLGHREPPGQDPPHWEVIPRSTTRPPPA